MPNPNASYQEELFEDFSQRTSPKRQFLSRGSLFAAKLISFDHFLFGAISGLIALVLAFSLGVERGKRVARSYDIPMTDIHLVTPLTPRQDHIPRQSAEMNKEVITTQETKKVIPLYPKESSYTILVVTYKDKKSAEKVIGQLRASGRKSFLLPKGDLMVICVGEYSTSAEASKAAKTFRKQFPDCFVKRL
jgi:hypothetical protein